MIVYSFLTHFSALESDGDLLQKLKKEINLENKIFARKGLLGPKQALKVICLVIFLERQV